MLSGPESSATGVEQVCDVGVSVGVFAIVSSIS